MVTTVMAVTASRSSAHDVYDSDLTVVNTSNQPPILVPPFPPTPLSPPRPPTPPLAPLFVLYPADRDDLLRYDLASLLLLVVLLTLQW